MDPSKNEYIKMVQVIYFDNIRGLAFETNFGQKIFSGLNSATYQTQKIQFTQQNQLTGFFGNALDNSVERLGFIQVDTECDNAD